MPRTGIINNQTLKRTTSMKKQCVKWGIATLLGISMMLSSGFSMARHGYGPYGPLGYQGYGSYYHNGARYKYYRGGNYYNYYRGGHYYRFYRNGIYFNSYNGRGYNNVYYRGRAYQSCRFIPAQRLNGIFIPARRVCW